MWFDRPARQWRAQAREIVRDLNESGKYVHVKAGLPRYQIRLVRRLKSGELLTRVEYLGRMLHPGIPSGSYENQMNANPVLYAVFPGNEERAGQNMDRLARRMKIDAGFRLHEQQGAEPDAEKRMKIHGEIEALERRYRNVSAIGLPGSSAVLVTSVRDRKEIDRRLSAHQIHYYQRNVPSGVGSKNYRRALFREAVHDAKRNAVSEIWMNRIGRADADSPVPIRQKDIAALSHALGQKKRQLESDGSGHVVALRRLDRRLGGTLRFYRNQEYRAEIGTGEDD